MLEGSKLPYQYWFMAVWYIGSVKKSISALEMQRQIGYKHYEPIWFIMLKIRTVMGTSTANNITRRNIKLDCNNFFNVGIDDKNSNTPGYKSQLSDFRFENIKVTAKNFLQIDTAIIENFKLKNVTVNNKKLF